MDKALKGLIVLLLILSAVALGFELKLFLQREEIKGRNILLARQTVELAKTIEVKPSDSNVVDLATRGSPRMQITEEQLKHFYQLDDMGKVVKDPTTGKPMTTGPGTLDSVLKELVANAGVQYTRLDDTRTGLEQTRTTLGETSNTLVKTEKDLSDTKTTLKTTEENLDTAKKDIETKKTTIEDLTQKNEVCQAKSEKQATEITKLTDKLADRDTALEAAKRQVEKLRRDLLIATGGGGETNAPPPGLRGQIIIVDTNWNFVVVDVIPDTSVIPTTDMMVQRDDKLVGKVRVSEVLRDRNFAICEVLPEWRQMPVSKGDYVFY